VGRGRRLGLVAAVLPDPLEGKVPHPTTLMKLTTRCGPDAVAGLNEALLAWAAGHQLVCSFFNVFQLIIAHVAQCGILTAIFLNEKIYSSKQ
jgi:hypothetical protein